MLTLTLAHEGTSTVHTLRLEATWQHANHCANVSIRPRPVAGSVWSALHSESTLAS